MTRRYLLGLGAAGVAAMKTLPLFADDQLDGEPPLDAGGENRELDAAVSSLESWLTPQDEFQDVSRGNPKPHSIPADERAGLGLTRETWQLNVIADPDHPADLESPMSSSEGTAFDFSSLMELAKTRAVRFPKVMTCLNIGCPLGMGIWEGVPMRDVIWKTGPTANLRRVVYFGFHNDDPDQLFRSSLPVGRVLEDPYGLPPVILCYKLNGHFLSPERGGPVRVVVPEAYGFKSIKWLTHLYLSNLASANDTYAEKNNDVDSPMKTFSESLSIPHVNAAGESIPVTGFAQVGISGLKKVQVSIQDAKQRVPKEDIYFDSLDWIDAKILPPPSNWGGDLPGGRIPSGTLGFDEQGVPKTWPLPLTKAHWAILLPGRERGKYRVRSRTIDENGNAQPMPRPFRKSGRAHIHQTTIDVT